MTTTDLHTRLVTELARHHRTLRTDGNLTQCKCGAWYAVIDEHLADALLPVLDADVTVYELRKGPDDDPHPLVLGLYTELLEAAAHGETEFQQAHGKGYDLRWLPDNCEDDASWSLYAADDAEAEEEATEWHIVPRVAASRFDADAEG